MGAIFPPFPGGERRSLTEIQVQSKRQLRPGSYPAHGKDSAECCCCCHPNDSTLTLRTRTGSSLLVPTAPLTDSGPRIQGHPQRLLSQRERLNHPVVQNLIWRSVSSVSCHPAMAKVNNETNTLHQLSATPSVHDGEKARLKKMHPTQFLSTL